MIEIRYIFFKKISTLIQPRRIIAITNWVGINHITVVCLNHNHKHFSIYMCYQKRDAGIIICDLNCSLCLSFSIETEETSIQWWWCPVWVCGLLRVSAAWAHRNKHRWRQAIQKEKKRKRKKKSFITRKKARWTRSGFIPLNLR